MARQTAQTHTAAEPHEPDPRLFVSSVQRAMQILESFDASRTALSIAEVSERTGLGRSAAQRFIYTLHHLGYLRKDPLTRKYSISHKVLTLADSVIGANTVADRALPILEELSEETRETVTWVELDDLEIVILKSIPSPHLSSVNLPVGRRFTALSSSSGQVMLAYAPPEVVLRAFEEANEESRRRVGLATGKDMLAYLKKVREAGFSVTEKMEDMESISISAPVVDFSGNAIGALNISALKSRWPKNEARRRLGKLVSDAARKASMILFR